MGLLHRTQAHPRLPVLYLDFQEYYKNSKNDAEIVTGGTLGPEDPWTSPIRRLCKKDVRVSLEKVCNAEIITLSPNESGYIFALTYFLATASNQEQGIPVSGKLFP